MSEAKKYLIVVNMYVGTGYVETGRFFIGDDKDEAEELFSQLVGQKIIVDKVLLRLDLVAHGEDLDTILGALRCTLEEMSENIKIILKETFRMLNLE